MLQAELFSHSFLVDLIMLFAKKLLELIHARRHSLLHFFLTCSHIQLHVFFHRRVKIHVNYLLEHKRHHECQIKREEFTVPLNVRKVFVLKLAPQLKDILFEHLFGPVVEHAGFELLVVQFVIFYDEVFSTFENLFYLRFVGKNAY